MNDNERYHWDVSQVYEKRPEKKETPKLPFFLTIAAVLAVSVAILIGVMLIDKPDGNAPAETQQTERQ